MADVAEAPEGTVDEPKRRRRWPWIVLGTLAILGLAAFFLGPVAISAYARSAMREAADENGFDLELSRCAFGWTSGLRLEGVRASERAERGIRVDVASVAVVPRWGGLIKGRLSLEEIVVDRPVIVVDPARRAPWPGMDEKSRAARAARAERAERATEKPATDPLEALKRVDAALRVTGAAVRILPAAGRPGLALEECSIAGRFDGETGHATSQIAGRFVTGERRDPLEMTLDLTLPPDGGAPRGEGTFQVGGLDLAVLVPLIRSTPRVESGVLRASGRLHTVNQEGGGQAIGVQADAQIADLRVSDGERVFDEPNVRFRFEGAVESIERVRIARGSVHGLPLECEADGVFALVDSRPSFVGNLVTRGKLGDLAAFLPPELALAGAFEGRVQVRDDDGTMVVTGAADLADLAVDQAKRAMLREANARAEVDLRVSLAGESPSATGTIDLRGTGVTSKVTITESSLAAQTAKVRIEADGTLAAVQQLAPMLQDLGGYAARGSFSGAWDVNASAERVTAKGGADLIDLVVEQPADADVGTAARVMVREKRVRADTDLTVVLSGESPSATGTIDLRGTGVTSKVTITESSLGAQTAKVRIETEGSVDAVRRLAPLVDSIESVKPLAGSFKGAWNVDVVARAIHAQGGADLTNVRYVYDGRTITEPTARFDADVRVQPEGEKFGARGTISIRGTAATLQAKLHSAALPAVAIDGTVTTDPARMLKQVGFELPAGFRVGGKVETKYVGQVNPGAKSKWLTGRFSVRGATLARAGVAVDNVVVEGDLTDERVRFARLDANLNGGRVSARANLRLDQPGRPFDVSFDVKGVKISQTLATLVRYVVPLYGLPEGVDSEVGGDIDVAFSMRGPLPTSFADLAQLNGNGRARVANGFVTGSPLVQKIMMAAKGRDRYAFNTVATSFRVRDGTVFHDSFTVKDREMAWGFRGKTGFDQAIDYSVNPGPLVERLYRRKERKGKMKTHDRILKELLKNTSRFPISVGGSLPSPTLKLTDLPVIGTGTDLGGAIGGALEGLFGKKKKKRKKN